ncbi:survival protein sure-like phosphatase/nucleotidase [Ampelomyces quisqualis]|uniref:Survival protein sure-like phosphatase/nucleotidase n=1 Tax=Ampelomyces quisqualis TaxID=50730 RepID=A0A6A5QED4_AMPQU|nr:survival protein sure-like phosphatase/nucleotidase [Ampelomyces quisqualis]
MLPYLLLIAVLPLTQGVRIIQTNQDGWSEANVRTFLDVLSTMGHDVLLSAPRYSYSVPPSMPNTTDCDNPPGCGDLSIDDIYGYNRTNLRLGFMNASQVRPIRNGIRHVGPRLWNQQKAELVLAGPDIGHTLGTDQITAPSVQAVKYAAHEEKIPAISFAGATGALTSWNAPTPSYSMIYAQLAENITSTVVRGGKPYLPSNTYLHVNFPRVTDERCNALSDFKFVLTRSRLGRGLHTRWCKRWGFPLETDVMRERGDECFVTISPGHANRQLSGPGVLAERKIIQRLGPILVCLPEA